MARRSSTTGTKTRFLTDQGFEDGSALLLTEYGKQHGQVTAPPVPINDIVEGYLKLAIEFRDLRSEVGDFGTDKMVLENAGRPLAGTFQVSAEARLIRLEELGLLLRKREASLFGTWSLANLGRNRLRRVGSLEKPSSGISSRRPWLT